MFSRCTITMCLISLFSSASVEAFWWKQASSPSDYTLSNLKRDTYRQIDRNARFWRCWTALVGGAVIKSYYDYHKGGFAALLGKHAVSDRKKKN